MAPVSVLPGRLRLECETIKGRKGRCYDLEHRLASISGILASSVNFRTGRILVQFDETIILQDEVSQRVEDLVSEQTACNFCAEMPEQGTNRIVQTKHAGRHILRDIVAHAILPKPLDILLPAISAFRR